VREVSHQRRAGILQVHQRQQISGAAASGRHIEAVDLGDEEQRLFRREPVEESEVLWDDADAALDGNRIRFGVDAENAHRAAAGLQQAGEALDRRGLARAIRSQKAIEAAHGHGEVNAVNGPERSEVARQAAGFDRILHRGIVLRCP
jgi:hypothetical protein